MLWQKKGKGDITGDRIPVECGRETKRQELRNAWSVLYFTARCIALGPRRDEVTWGNAGDCITRS